MNLTAFYEFWKQWFAQPEAAKLERSRASGKGGFYPLGSESPGYTGKPDPKEYYHWRLKEGDFGGPESALLFARCYEQAAQWCEARGLHEVARAVRPEDCVLRVLHYLPTADGLVGEAHRDFDLLTVSVPGTVPGLEVFDPGLVRLETAEQWGDDGFRPQEEGIQVGEMLEIYTRWDEATFVGPHRPATLHRVRTPPNTERFKAVFFYLPPMDFELRPGFAAKDYLLGPNGVLVKAGTAGRVKVSR